MTVSPIHDRLKGLVRTGTDVTVRQLVVLMECRETKRTVRELALNMGIAKPAISRAADRLTNWKYLVRRKDPNDRRSIFLELTAAGRKFVDKLTGAEE